MWAIYHHGREVLRGTDPMACLSEFSTRHPTMTCRSFTMLGYEFGKVDVCQVGGHIFSDRTIPRSCVKCGVTG